MGSILRPIVPNVVRSAERMETVLKASGLNWTSARAGFLNNNRDATYRAQNAALPSDGTSVPRLALARVLVDALDNPETHGTAFGVSHAAP